jgi:hypothetical protein
MKRYVISLDPSRMPNPDLDIRYSLPDRLTERSSGALRDDGYEYVGPGPRLAIYLTTADDDTSSRDLLLKYVSEETLLANRLSEISTVAEKIGASWSVLYSCDGSADIHA